MITKNILLLLFAAIIIPIIASAPASAATTTSSGNTTYYSSSVLGLSLVNQDPDPAGGGDIVEIRVGVENFGQQQINDLIIELIPSYPFLPLSGESLIQDVGTVGGYQTDSNIRVIKFKVRIDPQATAGEYNLKLWSYKTGIRGTHTENTFPLTVRNPENVQVIYVDKTVLVPGQVTPVTFTINNVGKGVLNHATFTWTNDDGVVLPVSGGSSRYIDSLGIGGSVNLTYQVIASTNAVADLYPMTLTLTYDDSSGSGTDSFSTVAGVYVGGPTDFAVSFDSSSGTSTSLNIANTGSNAASAVAITIPEQQGWRVTGSRTSMIGSLAKGDYTIANFDLSGRGPLEVNVDYTDTMGNRVTKQYGIAIDSGNAVGNYTGNGAGTGADGGAFAARGNFQRRPTVNYTLIIIEIVIALVVVGGGIAGFYAYQKRKRK